MLAGDIIFAIDDKEVEALSWEDGAVRADVSGLSNGSHVVRVTNADGAVSRAVFSLSSESAQGRGLFERSHALPVHEQAFLENDCDRIYDSIAACGGRIYAFAVSAKYRMPQGLWSYDLKADKWSPCPLPEGMQMMQALAVRDIETRLVIFKGENHELRRGGKPVHRIRRLDEITGWFDKHTK